MYLGLDLGTSGLKALLTSADGSIIGTASAHYDVQQPHANWSEQDPQCWIKACEKVFAGLKQSLPIEFSQIKAISTSGHMHGAVTIDENANPLRPCILWNDMRSFKEAAELDALPEFQKVSGNIVFPGFTAPKLLWMKNNEPELFAKIHKVLLPKDFLLHWLSGRFVGDMSDAAGTAWLDVANRKWSDELLAASGMRLDQMPDLVEGCALVGPMREELSSKFGLKKDVKIIAGGADNAVSACGVGAWQEGEGFVSLGTSGVLLAAKNSYAPDPRTAVHTFCHAIPDRWYQMGVMLSATNSLNWLAQILDKDPASVANLCKGQITGPSSVIFMPYLTGERTPHNDADIGGAFIGLKADTTAAEMSQAVMEGVSFGLRDCLEALKSTGTSLSQILAIGGGTNSDYWVSTLATILNLNLAIPEKGDFGAALGAARLAMIGDDADIEQTLTSPKISKVVKPNVELQEEYEKAYQRFRKLYPAIKSID